MTTTLDNQQLVNQFYYDKAYSKCVVFEGRQYLVYDYYQDPFDGEILACIPASDNDVAACEIFVNDLIPAIAVPDPFIWSLMSVETGPGAIPDYFRYVVLDASPGGMQS